MDFSNFNFNFSDPVNIFLIILASPVLIIAGLAVFIITSFGLGYIVLSVVGLSFILGKVKTILHTETLDYAAIARISIFSFGWLAPFYAFTLLIKIIFPDFWYGFPLNIFGAAPPVLTGIVAGACGFAVGLYGFIIGTYWRFKQAQQVNDLPTSTIRSAAIGLAEFKGIARRIDGKTGPDDLIITPVITKRDDGEIRIHYDIEPFYLEDSTGRILVDPRGAIVNEDMFSFSTFISLISDIYLDFRPAREGSAGSVAGRELRPGDEVYLLGSVQKRDEAPEGASGTDALVVKPLVEPVDGIPPDIRGDDMMHYSIAASPTQLSRGCQSIFFLTNIAEKSAVRQVYKGMFWTFGMSAAWALSSGWMLAHEIIWLVSGI